MKSLIRSYSKGLNISPQKLNITVKKIKGLSPYKAISYLSFSKEKGAIFVKKCIQACLANAESNLGADVTNLNIKSIFVSKSSTRKKRFARAKGRGDIRTSISSNLSVILS